MVQPASDFQSFSEAGLRGSDSYASTPFGRCLAKPLGESGSSSSSEGAVFGSMIALPASSSTTLGGGGGSGGGKHFEGPHGGSGELSALAAAAAAGYKRSQPSSSSSSSSSSVAAASSEDGVKGKKKRGNWRNRYGPCFTTNTPEPKMPEAPDHAAPSTLSASAASPALTASILAPRGSSNGSTGGGGGGGTAGMGVGEGLAIQKAPALLRNGSLQGLGVNSAPGGPGKATDGFAKKHTHTHTKIDH